MLNWFKRPRRTLLVMRYSDMYRVHPQMSLSHVCSRCNNQVGIYPSGQQILKKYRKRVDIICNVCHPINDVDYIKLQLAPGAENEPSQSVYR